MIPGRPAVYTDENVRRRLVEELRERGFDVLTAGEVGRLGDDDEAHLALAASLGRVLLTFDRGDFRRLHARFVDAGRTHAGIALLPQRGPLDRLVVRASMLLDWTAAADLAWPFLVNWNDLQMALHRGARPIGYDEAEIQLALGLTTESR